MERAEPDFCVDLADLKVIACIGRGATSIAFLVRYGTESLALKTFSRAMIENKQEEYRRVWFERDVLSALDHPLLPKLRGVIATEKIVGFAIQFCAGGDLKSLRKRQTERTFSIESIRFYAAELVVALEYLHGLGIVYRDLKPENVLVQQNGHLMLVDFDLSRKISANPSSSSCRPCEGKKVAAESNSRKQSRRFRSLISCGFRKSPVSPTLEGSQRSSIRAECEFQKSKSFVGTEDYVAPEIISGEGHGFEVDWWSLGVVLYEMLYGSTPFRGTNRKETFYRILTKSPDLAGDQTTPLRDLIARLLEKDPAMRIALNGIKIHEFFRGVVWDNVTTISRPPFLPAMEEPTAVEGEEIDVEEFVQSAVGSMDEQSKSEFLV